MPVEVLILFFGGIFGIGGIIILGQWISSKESLRSSSGGDVEQLTEAVESLRREVAGLGDSVLALDERVEFTERLLAAPKED
ncbi:MAG: hypothetical protein OEM96_08045 [Gemmatimonadota bacterium]|nr:hypothetical protein [Gemmatimonadota bacterium]